MDPHGPYRRSIRRNNENIARSDSRWRPSTEWQVPLKPLAISHRSDTVISSPQSVSIFHLVHIRDPGSDVCCQDPSHVHACHTETDMSLSQLSGYLSNGGNIAVNPPAMHQLGELGPTLLFSMLTSSQDDAKNNEYPKLFSFDQLRTRAR